MSGYLDQEMNIRSSMITPDIFAKSPILLRDYVLQNPDELQITEQEAKEIVDFMPLSLRGAPCFIFPITKQRCYEYCLPFDLPNGQVLFGSPQVQPVEKLVRAIKSALHYLDKNQCQQISVRLADFRKHFEVLHELSSLITVKNPKKVLHEVPGSGNKTIDWHFVWEDGYNILLEVKSRIYNVIEDLPEVTKETSSKNRINTDPKRLLSGLVSKFPKADCALRIQGALIIVGIKQDKNKLLHYYRQLDQKRLHFSILWSADIHDPKAYIMSCDALDCYEILHRLGFEYSESILHSPQ